MARGINSRIGGNLVFKRIRVVAEKQLLADKVENVTKAADSATSAALPLNPSAVPIVSIAVSLFAALSSVKYPTFEEIS